MLKGGGIFTIQRPHCLDDTARRDPPVVNAVITYRYQELTADNIPRFPTLVGWDLLDSNLDGSNCMLQTILNALQVKGQT